MTPEIVHRSLQASPEVRRMRLLTYVVSFLLGLCAMSLLLALFFNDSRVEMTYVLILTPLIVLLVAALVLARRRRLVVASWIVVVCSVVAPWLAILSDPAVLTADVFAFAYLGISVLICAVLLSTAATFGVAGTHLVGLLLAYRLLSARADFNWSTIFLFLITTTMVSAVYSALTRADMKQTNELLDLVRESEAKIRDLALRDPLTGVWNRRFMEETLPRECALAVREGRHVGYVMADLDGFKSINDRFGHLVGDRILLGVAQAILSSLRSSDLVFRYGGDEFLIILPDTDHDSADQALARIRTAVAAFPLPDEMRGEPPIRLTCGLAVSTNAHADSDALLAAADKELYRIKGCK